jgi:CRP/FNR family transcriptional regulator, cyclic AMP receptor protein
MATSSALASALAGHPFFSAIPTASLRRLAAHVETRAYLPAEQIFRENGVADRFLLIRHGLVRLDLDPCGPEPVEIELLGPDSALGWSWLFEPYRWQLSATAVERTSCLVFDADLMRAAMASDPVLGYELMRRFSAVLFDRLQATRRKLSPTTVVIPTANVRGPWAGRRTTSTLWV